MIAAGCGSDAEAKGVVTLGWMTWRDQTGYNEKLIKRCEAAGGGKFKINAVSMGPTTDNAREQLTRRLAAKDSSIDIVTLDSIWTSEFAAAGWLIDLTARVAPKKDIYIPAALESTVYDGKYWVEPGGTNVALLYYRSDIIKTPPKSWEEMKSMAIAAQKDHPDMAGFVFQAQQYEGLTVDTMEFMGAAGVNVLSKDGTKSTLDQGDGAEYALTFMQSLFKEGVTPKVVTTFQEEEGRQLFQNGNAIFMRNWPYVYPLAQGEGSKVVDKFKLMPLPPFEGRQSAGVLGGNNFGISAYSQHAEIAWKAMECLNDNKAQKDRTILRGELPVVKEIYSDPDVKKEVPYIDIAYKALESGTNRPITPYYNDLTSAIYRNANDVAAQRTSPKAAVKKMQRSIQAALDGNADI